MHPQLLRQFPIRRGSHPKREDGLCAMEMVAWLAGERHSDGPRCTCPVLAAYVRAFNDSLPDDRSRDRYLRPFLPKLVNAWGSQEESRWRAFLAADFAVRVLAPMALESRGQREKAEELYRLEPVVDLSSARIAAVVARQAGASTTILWVLKMACRDLPAVTWVGAVARAMREIPSRKAFGAGQELLRAMVCKNPHKSGRGSG